MSALRRRARADDGVYAIELMGLIPLFALAAIFAFQLASIGGAMSMAENAARSGSRATALGGDGRAAALSAVDPGVRDRTTVGGSSCASPVSGTTVTVCISVPMVIPLVDLDVTVVERSATLPPRRLGR
ncbi:hypothetical protein BH23ACT9_BH23ACT9_10720 [soil metagenome]